MNCTIQEAARRTGLTAYTIRYYEKEGLLSLVPRDPQGRRVFDDAGLDWLGYLTCLRLTGMPIATMRRIAELQAQGDATIPERRKLLEAHRVELGHRLEQIHSALDRVDHKIAWYSQKEKETNLVFHG